MRRALGAALVTACLLAGAGCSAGEPEVAPAPSSSSPAPSAAPSETPTAVAPTMPPEAMERTAAGAEAFVRFYFEAVNYGFATGDTSLMEQYSLPSCKSCRSTVAYINEPYEVGARWSGTRMEVRSLAVPPLDDRGAVVNIGLEQSDGAVVDAAGVTKSIPGQPLSSHNVYAEWLGDGWSMYELANVE